MSDHSESLHGVAIAAPHTAAVDAARTILEAGGNAVDAAVAAAAALTVVYPHMCSVGGDVIALLRKHNGTCICVNASGSYGSATSVEQLFGSTTAMPITGPLTVSVPGAVSGWAALLDAGGSLPLARVLAPAIKLAADGFPASPGLVEAISIDRAALWVDPGLRAAFFVDGQPIAAGHLLVQPELARTLGDLADHGLDSFYRGHTADRLAAGLEKLGVPVSREDLNGHRPTIAEPLVQEFSGFSVATAPPNSQGYTLLRSLGAVLAGSPSEGDIDAGVLAEIFYDSDEHRDTHLADPRHSVVELDDQLTPAGFASIYAAAATRAAGAERQTSLASPRPGGDTVGISVVARDGTAVSLIQSVFHSFGARVLEPETGLVMHNRAAFFTLDHASPNRVQAGKRPAHTLVPVIIEWVDGAVSAHSTMGGKAQSQIHTQLILRALAGLDPQQTVSAPRFIVGGLVAGRPNGSVLIEPTLEASAVEQIFRTEFAVEHGIEWDNRAGHSMVVRLRADGTLEAGADPRSDGGVAVCERASG